MKIEIKSNDIHNSGKYGDKILFINDEEVMTGNKELILKKLIKIIEAWI